MFEQISKHQEDSTRRSKVFLTKFEMFGNMIKHCLEKLKLSTKRRKKNRQNLSQLRSDTVTAMTSFVEKLDELLMSLIGAYCNGICSNNTLYLTTLASCSVNITRRSSCSLSKSLFS